MVYFDVVGCFFLLFCFLICINHFSYFLLEYILALKCCVGFCCTAKWMSYMYTHLYIATLWTVAGQAPLTPLSLKLKSIESVMLSSCIASHPLSLPSPPAFSVSQQQGLFQWVSSSLQVAKVLELQFQHQSFQWRFSIRNRFSLVTYFIRSSHSIYANPSLSSHPVPHFSPRCGVHTFVLYMYVSMFALQTGSSVPLF